jgi:Zn-dependent protease with chaperone function
MNEETNLIEYHINSASKAEKEYDIDNARYHYREAIKKGADDVSIIPLLYRLDIGIKAVENKAEHIFNLILSDPWNPKLIDTLIEVDPGYVVEMSQQILEQRRRISGIFPINIKDHSDFCHSKDIMLQKFIFQDSEVHKISNDYKNQFDVRIQREYRLQIPREGASPLESFKISEDQLPQLWNLYQNACKKIGVKPFELYLVNDDSVNAMAYGVTEPIIVINSGLYKIFSNPDGSLKEKEMLFVLGHEIGHQILKHSLMNIVASKISERLQQSAAALHSIGNDLIETKGFLRSILGGAAQIWAASEQNKAKRVFDAINEVAQYKEFSADRFGVIACGDIDSAIQALCQIEGIGTNNSPFERMGIKTEFNLNAYLRQYDEAWRTVHLASADELNSQHPYTPIRIRALQAWKLGSIYNSMFPS